MGCASLGRTLRSKVCPSKQETPAESDKGLDVVQVVEKEQTYTTSQPPPSILTTTTEPPDTQQLAQSAAERTGSTQSKKDRIGSATQPKQERGGSAAVLDTSQSVIIPPSIN